MGGRGSCPHLARTALRKEGLGPTTSWHKTHIAGCGQRDALGSPGGLHQAAGIRVIQRGKDQAPLHGVGLPSCPVHLTGAQHQRQLAGHAGQSRRLVPGGRAQSFLLRSTAVLAAKHKPLGAAWHVLLAATGAGLQRDVLGIPGGPCWAAGPDPSFYGVLPSPPPGASPPDHPVHPARPQYQKQGCADSGPAGETGAKNTPHYTPTSDLGRPSSRGGQGRGLHFPCLPPLPCQADWGRQDAGLGSRGYDAPDLCQPKQRSTGGD